MNEFTILERLQEDVRGRLLTTLPTGVSVLMQREGVLERDLEERLGTLNAREGRTGVAAVVRLPRVELAQGAGEAGEDRAGPQLTAHLELEVWENRTLNRPGAEAPLPSAEALALEVLVALHRFRPGASGGGTWLAGRKVIEPLSSKRTGIVGYLVRLETQFGLRAAEAVERPEGTTEGGPGGPWEVTLEAGSAGAALYYTRDGSFPWPGNAVATLYNGPVELELAEGESVAVVRAAAFLTGRLPSDVLELRLG